jgi:hypothetical protein
MKQTIQNRINNVKAISVAKKEIVVGTASSVRIINDNLSKSIRTKKDADIFQNELKIAIQQAKH